ncbi:morn repeat-containing protein, partial [Cystoisospora suis]
PPSLSSPSSTFSSSSSSPFSPSYTSSPLPPSSCSSFPSPPSSSLYANISSSSSPNSREVFFLDPQESTSDGPPQPSPGNDSHRFLTPDAPHTSKKLRETRDEGRKRFSFFHLKPGKRCSTSSSSLQADGSGGNDPIEWLYGEEDIPPPYQRGEEEDLSSTSLPGKESRGENKMATRQGRGGGEDEEEALDKQKKEEEKISGDDEETRRKERQREDERDSTGQHHIDSKSGRKTDHDRHAKHKDSLPQGHLFSSSSSHAQESSSFSSPRKHLEKREEKTNPFAAGEEEEGERRGGLQQTALSPFSDMTSDNRLDGRETRAMGASKSKDEERPTGVLSSSSSFSSSSAWKSCAGVGGALAQFSRFAFLKKLTTTAQGLPSGIPGEARERGKEEEESENSASSSSLHPTYVLDSSVERTSRHLSSSSSSQLSHLRSRTEIKRGDREKEEQEEEQEERRLIRREGRRKEGEEERGLHREGEGGARATALPTGDATWERAADLFRSAVAYHLELLSRQAAVAAGTQRSAQRFLAEIERQEKEEEDEEKKKKTQTKKEKEAYVPDSDDGRLKKSSGITLSTKDGIEGLRDASKREKRRDMEEEEKKNEASSSFCMGVGKGSLVKNFNPLWLRAWAATHNFQVWLRQHRLPVIVQEEEEREEEEKTSLSPSLIPPPAPPPQEGDVRYVYENRDVYEGQFLKGMRHGHGVYYSKKDGFSYEGEWKEDLRHGEGVLTHDKVGFVYVGQWYKDEKHGEGHLYSSTERYWGTFHHNKYQGKGTYVERVTGAQYEGEFSEGLFHGLGKLSLPSPSSSKEEGKSLGKTIEGHKNKSGRKAFSSSSPHVPLSSRCSRIRVKAPYSSSSLLSAGQGEEEDKETEEDQEREDGGGKKKKKKDASLKGVTICGEWDRGKVRGVATCAYEDGCLYTGTLQEDTLLPEGSGCMSFCDGSSYEGQWKNGRKHGTGVFTCRPSSPSSLFISSSLSKKNNRHEEAEKQEEEDHLHSHTTQEEEERGSFNKGEKRKTDTCSSSSSSSSRDERGGVNGRDDMRPGGYLVYEGVWYEDVPREKAEWIVTFPSGDKYIGCLSMKRSEEKNRYMKKEKEKQKKRRETERICATEGGEGGEREKEEEKGERMGGEDTEKKKEKEEEKERYDISEEEEKEEEEEDYSMYVVPHGEGLSKHKALGETYEGQWMYGARHGQGESISSEGVRYLGGWQCGYEHGEGLLVNTDTQKQYEGKFLYGRFISRDSSHLHTKKNKKDEEEEKKREEEEDEEEERRDVTKFSHKRKILFYESFLVYPIHLSPFFWESSTH